VGIVTDEKQSAVLQKKKIGIFHIFRGVLKTEMDLQDVRFLHIVGKKYQLDR
jgi:hypothetical protein